MQSFTLPAYFGGVELSEMSTVTKAEAVTLAYFLDSSEDWMMEAGTGWEEAVLNDVLNLTEIYCPDLRVSVFMLFLPSRRFHLISILCGQNSSVNKFHIKRMQGHLIE